ncbi:MAG: hypothetical protein NWE94_01820 [Candidatus Bathyarchaeota archaeon]|nr:hypothetical protein [Candidatus Bathyarchaeota archaeon]
MKWLNRLLLLIYWPLITATWLLGWMLYWVGDKCQRPRLQETGDACIRKLRGADKGYA